MTIPRALHDEARRCGLSTRYDFCGEVAYGVDRNDAIRELMKKVYGDTFKLLQIKFGASARFQPRPLLGNGMPGRPDFYWRKCKFGIILTPPLYYRADDGKLHNDRSNGLRAFTKMLPGKPDIWRVPYYVVLHTPKKFLEAIRARLISSGVYPRLL
jgi:hypothetical protein